MSEWVPEIGSLHERPWPFMRAEEAGYSSEFCDYTVGRWRPGFSQELCGPYGDDTEVVCDAVGTEIFEVVSVHKPGPKYPTRVFYVRRWRDPDGKVFGSTSLKCKVAWAFRNMLRMPEYLDDLIVKELAEDAA